jgi:cytochrome c oxidase cbb3-type subunit 3
MKIIREKIINPQFAIRIPQFIFKSLTMLLTFKHKTLKKAATLSASLIVAFASHAQTVAAPSGGGVNWLLILLVIVALVLLMVIWGLGQIILMLGRQLNDKRRNESKLGAMLVLIGLLFAGSVQGQAADAAPATVVSDYGGLNALEFWALASVLFIEVLVIFFMAFMARRMYRELRGIEDKELGAALETSRLMQWWKSLDAKWMTKAVPLEKEADILLDHDYDGIKELDNALPPWWKYGFYFTLVVAVIYIMNYHVLGIGMNPEQEYAAQMEEGKRVEEAYKAKTKNLVDENNVTMADAAGVAEGKKAFLATCIACHGKDGEGGIGPNLVDDYWIHGGSMNDIYKTIKLGYPEKGMQSWQSMFNPVQIKELSSFVKSLKGTKPANPKAPQGDLYKE